MKRLEEYFSEASIIDFLCKTRAKVANTRSKKHQLCQLTSSKNYNYHVTDPRFYSEYEQVFFSELSNLLPGRRKWVKLGDNSRKTKSGKLKSSFDKNYLSLKKTISKYRQIKPGEPFLQDLNIFIEEVQSSVLNNTYTISPPTVYPKLKNSKKQDGPNPCRPISLFSLRDRLVLSLTNKYLTDLIDPYFKDCSFAFRQKKSPRSGNTLTHHDCISEILEFKSRYPESDLWVFECDIKKFYDSVDHKVVLELLEQLLDENCEGISLEDINIAKQIFISYLNAYSFNETVIPLNEDQKYWEEYKIPNGKFEWIEDNRFSPSEKDRIGVPQGGALSGLIANIVLHEVDKEMLKTGAFYIRFCDDMILISHEFDECSEAKNQYAKTLLKLKLFPHPFKNDLVFDPHSVNAVSTDLIKKYWKEKSKGPYLWGTQSSGGFPWVGFVGYEVHYKMFVRVRKRSLLKEQAKQKAIIKQYEKAIRKERRKNASYIRRSLIHKLIGMSVGKVSLRNFETFENDLCWKNGFRQLNKNKYSIQQMKQLDRNRNRLFWIFSQNLEELPKVPGQRDKKRNKVEHFNKPFSYFYQILERDNNDE